MPKQDIVALNEGYPHYGLVQEAVQLLHRKQDDVRPDKTLLAWILKTCPSLWQGKLIHIYIINNGLESDLQVGNTLISMYAKAGSFESAHVLFERSLNRNVVTWNAMIAGFVQHKHGADALQLFQQMPGNGIEPSRTTFVLILKACSNIRALEQGRLRHCELIEMGFESNVFVGSTLVDMYSKSGSLEDAIKVFNTVSVRNLVTWTAMIAGYVQYGHGQKALQLFQQMIDEGIEPNEATFICVLKACCSITALTQGKIFHTSTIEMGFESNVPVSNTLIDMYAKCGSLEDACQVFERLKKKDVVTWNAMIAGYVQHGRVEMAFQVFQHMQLEEVEPQQATHVCILKACSNMASLERGKLVHADIIESGLESDIIVSNTLIGMYVKCAHLEDAYILFSLLLKKDVITWNAMIGGYAIQGHYQDVLQLFHQMQQEGIKPDSVTFVCILKGFSSIAEQSQVELIHALVTASGFESDLLICNSLIAMYGKCGSLSDAQILFDRLMKRDAVTLNTMVAAYSQHGYSQEALQLFQQWQYENMKLDNNSYVCILKACSTIGALDQGNLIHSHLTETGYEVNIVICNTLIDMYAKCGSMKDACNVFKAMSRRAGHMECNDCRVFPP